MIDSPAVKDIAKRLGKEPAQVLIAWATKSGFCVIPKSVTPSRIAVSHLNQKYAEISAPDNTWGSGVVGSLGTR